MTAETNSSANQPPKDLIGFLDYYLVQKAPFQLPEAIKEVLVKFGPWIVVLLLVLSLPALFMLFGLSVAVVPYGAISHGLLWSLAFCVQLGLMVLSLPGLFARKMSGWTLMFYSQVVGVVASLLTYAILGALIGGLIGFYILFQIRSLYRN
jgi:hypothetical protein